jgi:outer membrane protein OmpA-like peptidoglycan-associated protein
MKKPFHSWAVKAAAIATAFFAAGCAEHYIDKLEHAKLEGLPFADHLAKEYELFAKRESRVYNDNTDAAHFAVKGLQAATGLNVLPEDPRKWDLTEADFKFFHDARKRLTFALDKSGRRIAPALAARTQVFFDCAVEESEEGFQKDNIAKCKAGFINSLRDLEKAVHEQSPTFSVHFALNSSKLDKKAHETLAKVAKVAKNINLHAVIVTGHTDGVGGRKHNLVLSHNRAIAVRDALAKMGLNVKRLESVGGGELDGAEVDPSNRRVDVHIH